MDERIMKNVYKRFKQEIAIDNFENEIINKYPKGRKSLLGGLMMKKRVIITICSSLVLISGVVLATNIKNIKKSFRGLGDGIDVAVQSGYIENTEMNFKNSLTTIESNGKVIKDIEVGMKIENFIMDDKNLSTQFIMKLNDKTDEVVKIENIRNAQLNDLIISDEENRIIYGGNNKKRFEEFCKSHKLNYKFGECNKNYLNIGLNAFVDNINKEDRTINLMYNMYADEVPKSKKLIYDFANIIISDGSNKINIKGNWNFEVDVPENMYNRVAGEYKVISCDNDDFSVYSAKLTNTGFEIGVKIKNLQMPEKLGTEELKEIVEADKNLENGKISKEKANELKKKYEEYDYKNTPISTGIFGDRKASYVENSNGDTFECTLSPSREAKTEWIDENNYDFYETFSMTKYNSTNKIKVVLFLYEKPVTIELEKK